MEDMEEYELPSDLPLGRNKECALVREVICEFMKSNKTFALGKFQGREGMALRRQTWKQLIDILEGGYQIQRNQTQLETVS